MASQTGGSRKKLDVPDGQLTTLLMIWMVMVQKVVQASFIVIVIKVAMFNV